LTVWPRRVDDVYCINLDLEVRFPFIFDFSVIDLLLTQKREAVI